MPSTCPDFIGDVRKFMLCFGQDQQVARVCALPPQKTRDLREQLITSEYIEFKKGWIEDDMVEIADGLVDLIYVIVGTALAYGIPLDKCWRAVQEANMSKLWSFHDCQTVTAEQKTTGWTVRLVPGIEGSVGPTPMYAVLDETGKVRKPPGWKDPMEKIHQILAEASQTPISNPEALTDENLKAQTTTRNKWNEALAKEGSPSPGDCPTERTIPEPLLTSEQLETEEDIRTGRM